MSLQKTATIVSSITAFLLLVIKFSVGIISGSIAVLSSAIDSLLDLFVSLFNYFAVSRAEKEPDSKYNYGRGKIEALASLFEGLIITGSGFYILYISINKFINKETISYLGESVLVMIISVLITGILVYFLEYVVKKTNNLVIKSDVLHYKTDLFSNAGILIGLVVIHYTGFYLIDSIIGIIISFYIIYSAFELIKTGYLYLMDASIEKKEVKKIKKIIMGHKRVTSYHFLKTRQIGNTKFVEVHIVFNKKMLLLEAHDIGDMIEEEIPKIDIKSEWNITLHLDPYDDSI
ncbi:MAG: cation diffusion facilitator family transporter [Candidatus Gracilibacteria bacterium]